MKRLPSAFTLALAVLAPATARAATPGSTYDFCGGSGFTFCASVNLGVTAKPYPSTGYTVTLTIVNRSQPTGSYAPAQFVSIGLDNVLPPGQTLSSPSNFHFKQWGWDATTSSFAFLDVCGSSPTCWNMATNKNEAGGVKVDFDANTSLGNQVSVAANCSATDAHWNVNPLNTCGRQDDQSLWRPVQISFDVNQSIASADLYVKAIANGSTECLTGTSKPAISCTMVPPPPTTTTPEPASMLLLGTGLLGLAGRSLVRRRSTRA